MGNTITIVGKDTFTIFDRVLSDFADGTISTITFNNDLVGVKTGKNGNSIISGNATGLNAIAVLRVMRGSSDDILLLGKLNAQLRDLPSFVLGTGEYVKRLGDGQGGVKNDVYTFVGGSFTKTPDTQENVEGDTEQGVAVYNLTFTRATRSIQ